MMRGTIPSKLPKEKREEKVEDEASDA